MPSIRIVDLDNCISDDAWRRGRIKQNIVNKELEYVDYHKHCLYDEFRNRDLVEDTDDQIVIFTGRPIAFERDTNRWLERNLISPLEVFMRARGNFSSSVELKESMLKELLQRQYFSEFGGISKAYDDREDIVAMYLRNEIPAEVRKINEVNYKG